MELALSAVRNEGVSHSAAARQYGVPRTTLIDRLKGRISDNAVMGAKTVLNKEEEEALCQFVVRSAKAGFPLQRLDLKNWVKQILDLDGRANPFKDNRPGE